MAASPSPPQLPAGEALASSWQEAGAIGDVPAVSSVSAVSILGSVAKLERNELKPETTDDFLDGWNAENIEKLKKYQVAYARRLKAKYFSKKTLHGVDIFDHETRVDNNVIIKSSRWPHAISITDPFQKLEAQNGFSSSTEAETLLTTRQESTI